MHAMDPSPALAARKTKSLTKSRPLPGLVLLAAGGGGKSIARFLTSVYAAKLDTTRYAQEFCMLAWWHEALIHLPYAPVGQLVSTQDSLFRPKTACFDPRQSKHRWHEQTQHKSKHFGWAFHAEFVHASSDCSAWGQEKLPSWCLLFMLSLSMPALTALPGIENNCHADA